jgi:hypothetical protein
MRRRALTPTFADEDGTATLPCVHGQSIGDTENLSCRYGEQLGKGDDYSQKRDSAGEYETGSCGAGGY